MSELETLITAARSYSGVRFLHAGRSRQGLDCVGLLIVAARDAGLLSDYDHRDYGQVINPDILRAEIERFCLPIAAEQMQAGDVLLFAIAGSAQHVGLCAQAGSSGARVLHAYQSAGKVVEHALDGRWQRRLVAVYRFRGGC